VGTDAAWLLARGFQVHGIDASEGMISAARARAGGATFTRLPAESVGSLSGPFDGALLDFGVINCVDVSRVAAGLSAVLPVGAPLIVVTMPRLAPAWVLGALKRGRVRAVRQRLSATARVDVEGQTVETRYLGGAALRRALRPAFVLEEQRGLGFLLPPPGSRRSEGAVDRLDRIERPLRGLPVVRRMGDHVLLVFRRAGPHRRAGPAPRRVRSAGPVARRLRTRRAQRTGRVHPLRLVVFEVTRGCQSACTGCSHRGPAGGEALSVERCGALARDAWAAGCQRAVITGGEPLLRSDISALLAAVRVAGLSITLLTNGLALRRTADVVARWCDEVVISLDGADRDSYRRTRGVDGLPAVAAGVAAVRELAPGMRITARVTVSAQNAGSLRAIAEAARGMGVDGVSFLAMDTRSGDAFGRDAFGSDASAWEAPPPAEPEALRAELEALRAALPSGFLVDSDGALERIWRLAAAAAGGGPAGPPRCDAPWTSAVIGADLSLRPCFFLPPSGGVEDGLAAGLAAAAPTLAELDLRREEACGRCVCWGRFT